MGREERSSVVRKTGQLADVRKALFPTATASSFASVKKGISKHMRQKHAHR
jgi:hypothetical protein